MAVVEPVDIAVIADEEQAKKSVVSAYGSDCVKSDVTYIHIQPRCKQC